MFDVWREPSTRGDISVQMDRSEAMGPRLRGDDVLLSRQHTDAPINAAAMKTIGDISCGNRPFQCVNPKTGQMRANSNLLAEHVAGRGNFRACPELIEHTPAGGGAGAVAGGIG